MPWTFFDSSGRKLNTSSTSVADLDIDGATDIGAAIVDADLFIIDDGAGGTNRKTAASRIKTYIGSSAVTREGGNTSEATSTATSDTALLAAASLTIQATEPILFSAGLRRTTGASIQTAVGLVINSTTTRGTFAWQHTNTNTALECFYQVDYAPRVSGYLQAGLLMAIPNGGFHVHGTGFDSAGTTVDAPTAEVTSLSVLSNSTNSSVTQAADEAHAYSFAAS